MLCLLGGLGADNAGLSTKLRPALTLPGDRLGYSFGGSGGVLLTTPAATVAGIFSNNSSIVNPPSLVMLFSMTGSVKMAMRPVWTKKLRPLTLAASSEASQTTSGATSFGLSFSKLGPTLPDRAAACLMSPARVIRVPALDRMALRVTPYLTKPRAMVRVRPTMPSLAAE